MLMVGTQHHTLVQTRRMYSTESEPQCQLWSQEIMTCQGRFISDDKCMTRWEMLIEREAVLDQVCGVGGR